MVVYTTGPINQGTFWEDVFSDDAPHFTIEAVDVNYPELAKNANPDTIIVELAEDGWYYVLVEGATITRAQVLAAAALVAQVEVSEVTLISNNGLPVAI